MNMKITSLRPHVILSMVFLLSLACLIPLLPTATPQPAGGSAASPIPTSGGTLPGAPPATGDTVEILSVSPPVPAGISIADPLTVLVDYNLTLPEGLLQIWFERFSDVDCTLLGSTGSSGTTIAGTMQTVESGHHTIAISVPPLPLLEVAYVGVGVRLWMSDGNTTLAEDVMYNVCFAVKEPPAGFVLPPPAPGPGTGGENGDIAGIVYADNNGNGLMDAGESGRGSIEITLADLACATILTTARTDVNGNYGFTSLPTGLYCVVINYSSGLVTPGFWQRVEVTTGNISSANFGIQPIGAAPLPPPTTSLCGNGIVDASAGEQCDPPNLTNCTASCQTYVGYCGNGIVDVSLGEQCDPPNLTDCTATCQNYVAYCGNGIIDSGEQCDPPNITDCTASCQSYTAVCGNGFVDPGEQCDPPNLTNCTATCQNYGGTASISGTVYIDSDGDGVFQPSEPVLSVTVQLLDGIGNILSITSTDDFGHYSFSGLGEGVYTLRVTLVDGRTGGYNNQPVHDGEMWIANISFEP